jgi:hypothetical protein
MKCISCFILGCFFILISSHAQIIDIKYLAGNWNRTNMEKINKTDTLVFSKVRTDSSYRYWSFKITGDLNISSGYVTHNNEWWIANESEDFKWTYDVQNNVIAIENDKKNEFYKIIGLSEDRLLLIRFD